MFFTPIQCRTATANGSRMNVTFQLRRKYSLGSNSSADFVHMRLRHQWSSMCSRKFGTQPAPHSTADHAQPGEPVEHAASR